MITEENVQQIQQDLIRAGIDYLPLRQELTDHICTDIEKEIAGGKSFYAAYQKVKLQYVDNALLLELQNETKNLLDYRSLFLKRLFLFLAAITIVGFLFKSFKIPGGSNIQFLSILVLSVLFFKIGYTFSRDRRQKYLKRILALEFYIIGTILPVSYFLNSFFPDMFVMAARLNMICYLLLSLSLTTYFSSSIELNIFGITTETRKTDLCIATLNLFLAFLSIALYFGDYSTGLEYILFIILGSNLMLTIYYLLIRQRFKNKLISLLLTSTIITHIYYIPHFIHTFS